MVAFIQNKNVEIY